MKARARVAGSVLRRKTSTGAESFQRLDFRFADRLSQRIALPSKNKEEHLIAMAKVFESVQRRDSPSVLLERGTHGQNTCGAEPTRNGAASAIGKSDLELVLDEEKQQGRPVSGPWFVLKTASCFAMPAPCLRAEISKYILS